MKGIQTLGLVCFAFLSESLTGKNGAPIVGYGIFDIIMIMLQPLQERLMEYTSVCLFIIEVKDSTVIIHNLTMQIQI